MLLKKEEKWKKSFFSLLTEGIQNEKIHFSCFFAKFHPFASQRVFSVKISKNERNELNFFVERGQTTWKSVGKLLFPPPSREKSIWESVFTAGGWKKKLNIPLGGAYNLAISREKKKKKRYQSTWKPLGELMTEGFWYLAFTCEEKKKKVKNSTFSLFAPAGVWTQNHQKMAKPDVKLCLRPRSQLWDLSRLHRPRW